MRLMMGIVLVALATGCSAPVSLLPRSSEVPIPEGKGQLLVRWTSDGSRGALPPAWAASVADAYELLVLGPQGWRGYSLENSQGQAIALEPGSYRVQILAGVKRSSGSSTALLMGSGGADSVVVEAGKRTPLVVSLKTIETAIGAGPATFWKSPVAASASGRTHNPVVGMSLAGASTTLRPRFRSMDLWSGYREASIISGTPDDWSMEALGTAPASGTAFSVALIGAAVCLKGWDDVWTVPSGLTAYTWVWPTRSELADGHPMVPWSESVVALGPPPTGVEVSLTWE